MSPLIVHRSKPTFKEMLLTFVISLALIGAGFVFRSDLKGTFEKTEAEIVNIEWRDGIEFDDPQDAIGFVTYTANGKEYENIELGVISSSKDVGDRIMIEYNVDNPVKIHVPSAKFAPYILFTFGGIGLLISLGTLLVFIKKSR